MKNILVKERPMLRRHVKMHWETNSKKMIFLRAGHHESESQGEENVGSEQEMKQ